MGSLQCHRVGRLLVFAHFFAQFAFDNQDFIVRRLWEV